MTAIGLCKEQIPRMAIVVIYYPNWGFVLMAMVSADFRSAK